jgi:hypothetical protein
MTLAMVEIWLTISLFGVNICSQNCCIINSGRRPRGHLGAIEGEDKERNGGRDGRKEVSAIGGRGIVLLPFGSFLPAVVYENNDTTSDWKYQFLLHWRSKIRSVLQ